MALRSVRNRTVRLMPTGIIDFAAAAADMAVFRSRQDTKVYILPERDMRARHSIGLS